jgi:signal transduction histidine kinase/CheY-like chemotaxis protein
LKRWTLADFAGAILLTALYVLLAMLGLRLHPINNFATLVWPPTGVALVAMLVLGNRFWPSIALGAFLANLWTGAPVVVALGIAAGNTLEAVAGAYLLRTIPGFRSSLDRLTDVLGLVGLAAVLSSALAATVGVASLVFGGIIPADRFGMTWRAWWLGDAIADLVLAPLLLTWGYARRDRPSPARIWEGSALGVLLVLMSILVFEVSQRAPGALLAPLLVWAAVRFEQRGASGAMFLVCSIAVWATLRGHGPFALDSIEDSLFRLQVYMALNAGTFLVLGALTSERRRAREEAEEANRSKDRFLAALSHELRTPLMPVLALSSSLEQDAALPAETRKQLEIVRRNTELEARLIDDLLDLTRIEKGKLRVELAPVALGQILDHVVEICRGDIATRGLTFERKGPAAGTLVMADAARLQQVLWNLIQNAIKFTPHGGKILLRTTTEAGRATIEVTDTGVGIEPSQLDTIFQPFRQAGQRGGGLGLGLAISSGLVEAQRGTLTASSAGPGQGSTFRVKLPASLGGRHSSGAADATRTFSGSSKAHRVLLVEDHADTLAAARELLADLSCDVVAAASLEEALAAAEDQTFDLVVSDLGLPDGSGLELMRRLRDRFGLAGIALTGYGTEEDITQSRQAGFVDHLVKPVTFQTLARAIERFFAGRRPASARS